MYLRQLNITMPNIVYALHCPGQNRLQRHDARLDQRVKPVEMWRETRFRPREYQRQGNQREEQRETFPAIRQIVHKHVDQISKVIACGTAQFTAIGGGKFLIQLYRKTGLFAMAIWVAGNRDKLQN
jgi:hypothetical protein